MRNETIGVLDLRRNLSALLETTQRRPLTVHRYGSPWVCVVSDPQWQEQSVLLDFDPQGHPLAALLRLQQALSLPEKGSVSPAMAARGLLLMAMHGIQGLPQLHDQVIHHRLWHWFVAGAVTAMDGWQLPALRQATAALLADADAAGLLSAFGRRPDVMVLARQCGGIAPLLDADACRRMTSL